MDTFEFEDVHKWMETVGWEWGTGNLNELEVPDLYTIRRRARDLLKEAAKIGYCATGGFTARLDEGKDSAGPWVAMSLHFGYQSYNDGTTYSEEQPTA